MPGSVDAALRELINALSKAAMYPAGHNLVVSASAALGARLNTALADRGSITIGVTPRGMLLDGTIVEPLPPLLRDFAIRLHRKNVGTLVLQAGITGEEVESMLSLLSATDADAVVAAEGLHLSHIRIEPIAYDVLAFSDSTLETDLDDVFWAHLLEAAFGRRLAEGEAMPTAAAIAEAITERSAQSVDDARRVFEALAGFSGALAARGDRASGSARKRFVDVLAALSRPTTTRVVAAAPSSNARRVFLRDTLSLVPPSQLLLLLESVAEADGAPISPQLRSLLGKLAGVDSGSGSVPIGAFVAQVGNLIEQWDGSVVTDDEDGDPRLGMEPARIVAIGLELACVAEPVLRAATALGERGQVAEVMRLLDQDGNDPATTRTIADTVLGPGLLARLLDQPKPDFVVMERVVQHAGADAVGILLNALGAARERSTRRRLLDLLAQIGPAGEPELMSRLPDAPWFLARNILAVLAQLPTITNLDPVFAASHDPEPRVRLEAVKVLLRHPSTRDRAAADALESGDEALAKMALAGLAGQCPPALVAPVLSLLRDSSDELRLHAIRLLAGAKNPLVVPQLLALVRAPSGVLRRQRLLPKSPVMLAALAALAGRWRNHRPVLAVIQLASKSSDPEIKAAIGSGA
jgi:hypothetical protein